MDTEHVTAICTSLGSLREDANGRDVYVKHDDCLGICQCDRLELCSMCSNRVVVCDVTVGK